MTTTTWPFGTDADEHDPLTAHRIAVTHSHPSWRYLVAFDRESEERPTDHEAALLASFLDEYKARWYYPSFIATMAERPLDVDGGANGVIFHKFGADDWGFRRHSFTRGYTWSVVWPRQRASYLAEHPDAKDVHAFSLLELMDRIHTIVDHQSAHWVEWKAARPELFGGAR
jgi:hypothetical protein